MNYLQSLASSNRIPINHTNSKITTSKIKSRHQNGIRKVYDHLSLPWSNKFDRCRL